MGGNSEGGKKSLETRLQKYGEDHMKKIGALGGAKSKGRTPWNKGKKLKKEEDNARQS